MTLPYGLHVFLSLQMCVLCMVYLIKDPKIYLFFWQRFYPLPFPYCVLFSYKPVPMPIYPLEFDKIRLEEVLLDKNVQCC